MVTGIPCEPKNARINFEATQLESHRKTNARSRNAMVLAVLMLRCRDGTVSDGT